MSGSLQGAFLGESGGSGWSAKRRFLPTRLTWPTRPTRPTRPTCC